MRVSFVFAGWGADEHLFNYPVAEGYDYLLCFDYRTLDFDYALLDGYQSIHLAAWSMGVWAASCIFSGKDYPWESLVAINGTPCPVHDCYGIPEAVLEERFCISRSRPWYVFAVGCVGRQRKSSFSWLINLTVAWMNCMKN